MKLLPNEEEIIQPNADKIILTNQRIIMNDAILGQSYSNYIFLENISSIETKYKSNIMYLFLGVITILIGVFLAGKYNSVQLFIAGVIIGSTFILLWLFSRTHIVSIVSDGGSAINFVVSNANKDKINEFIYNVSFDKQKRVNQLYKV